MSSSSFARIRPGSLCITLLRSEPRNAGRIVQVIAFEGAMPELGWNEVYCVEALDQDRLLVLFELGEYGQESCIADGPIALVDRKYLRLLAPPRQPTREQADVARSSVLDLLCPDDLVLELQEPTQSRTGALRLASSS